MQTMTQAVRAYASASERRSVREQEAEVFRRANAALRRARESEKRISWVRALADNDRLWITVLGLLNDPANELPEALRASIISVGLAVQREMQRESPNVDFLIAVNENIASGLHERP
jgi:flagellar protein FlaF